MSILLKLSIALFVVAELAFLLIVGSAAWPLTSVWALAAVIVAVVWTFIHRPAYRLVLAVALLPACVVLTTLGGLFYLPAAATLVAAAAVGARRRPAEGG